MTQSSATWSLAAVFVGLLAGAEGALRSGRGLTSSQFLGQSRLSEVPVDWSQHGRDWSGKGQCGNMDASSPINFDDLREEPLALNKKIFFNYLPITHNFSLVNDGFSVFANLRPDPDAAAGEVDPKDIGGIMYDTGYHQLTRIDFHSGSEHTFGGKHLPLEIQLTHAKKDSPSRIIVSFLFDIPSADPPLEPLEVEEEGGAPAFIEVFSRRENWRSRANRGFAKRKSVPLQDLERPANGPVQPGFNLEEPTNPNTPALYSETGLTEEDVNGMAYETIGKPVDGQEVERVDDYELNYVDSLDLGENYTETHGAQVAAEVKKDGGPNARMFQGPPSMRKKQKKLRVHAAPKVNFGLVGAGSTRNREDPAPPAEGEGEGEGEGEPEVVVYDPPAESDPMFNPLLQFFEMDALPLFKEETRVNNSATKPMYLNDFYKGATFFEYGGTATLPPCEAATWLVRREVGHASTRQVEEFYRTLHLMSEQAGNYRTLMPKNGRVYHLREGIISTAIPPGKVVAALKDDKQRVFQAQQAGEDAVKISETAQNYARSMDIRLKRSAIAHALALDPTPRPIPVPGPPPPGIPYSQKWLDPELVKRAMGGVADSHVKAVTWESALHGAQGVWNASYEGANMTGQAWNEKTQAWLARQGPASAPAGAPGSAPGSAEPLDLSNVF